jgi:HK97 family phage portal protein
VWPFRKREDRDFSLEQLLAEDRPNTAAGTSVGSESAQRLAAVWACVRLLGDVISTMPCHAYTAGSRDPMDPAPVMLRIPAAGVPFHDWIAQIMRSLLLAGNAWGLVTSRVGAGLRPSQVELIAPHRVTVNVGTDGVVTYRLDGREIDRDDLWHLRAYPWPGSLLGLSPIAHCAQSVGVGLAAEAFGAKFFGDGATPSGVLASDQRLGRDQVDQLSAIWHAYFSNRTGQRRVAVLGDGLKFQPVSVAPEESQFLDTQRFTVAQICRIYGVPPEMIAAEAGNSLTYANVEQRSLDFLTYTINPWLVRLETALTDLVPRGQYVKFNAGGLLRTDLKTRYESYEIGLRAGFLTVDEVRELEDREPLPATPPRQIGAAA